jgi:hypothetical protein
MDDGPADEVAMGTPRIEELETEEPDGGATEGLVKLLKGTEPLAVLDQKEDQLAEELAAGDPELEELGAGVLTTEVAIGNEPILDGGVMEDGTGQLEGPEDGVVESPGEVERLIPIDGTRTEDKVPLEAATEDGWLFQGPEEGTTELAGAGDAVSDQLIELGPG